MKQAILFLVLGLLCACGKAPRVTVVVNDNGEPRLIYAEGTHVRQMKLAVVASNDSRITQGTVWLFYTDRTGIETRDDGSVRRFTWQADESSDTMTIKFDGESPRRYTFTYDHLDRFVMTEGNAQSIWESVVEPVE